MPLKSWAVDDIAPEVGRPASPPASTTTLRPPRELRRRLREGEAVEQVERIDVGLGLSAVYYRRRASS